MVTMTASIPRRTLLAGGLCLLAPAWLAAGPASAAIAPDGPPAAEAGEVAFLNRVTWGVDSAALAQCQRQSRREYLREQLHPPAASRLPAAAQAQIDAYGLGRQPMPAWVAEIEQRRRDLAAIADVEARKAAQQLIQQDMGRLGREAACVMLLNALYSPDQLREQLTWFWFNHFNVFQGKGNLRLMLGDYEAGLRRHALGRFGDLLIASATHTAMLRYLDNEKNAADRINENYARELMELHTLGVEGGYTQVDVQELARVLTGLGTNFSDRAPPLKPGLRSLYVRQGGTEFNPARHDLGDKRVLGVRVAGGGWDAILGQLDRLARHPSTARHVCGKLAVYFVADQPPRALVDRMSRAFTASDGDIAVTLQALFDAPEFSPSLSRKFKDPMHYVVSAVRLAHDGQTIVNPMPMLDWLIRMGQGLYNRQTPDGYPLDAGAWSSSGQMNMRFDIARTIGSNHSGLMRPAGADPAEPAAPPPLQNALYKAALAPTLGERTLAALDSARSPAEWNALLLSAPEFMFR